MRTTVFCSDGKRAVDLDSSTDPAVHRDIQRWFETAAPDAVLRVVSLGSTVLIQKKYVIRIEAFQ